MFCLIADLVTRILSRSVPFESGTKTIRFCLKSNDRTENNRERRRRAWTKCRHLEVLNFRRSNNDELPKTLLRDQEEPESWPHPKQCTLRVR